MSFLFEAIIIYFFPLVICLFSFLYVRRRHHSFLSATRFFAAVFFLSVGLFSIGPILQITIPVVIEDRLWIPSFLGYIISFVFQIIAFGIPSAIVFSSLMILIRNTYFIYVLSSYIFSIVFLDLIIWKVLPLSSSINIFGSQISRHIVVTDIVNSISYDFAGGICGGFIIFILLMISNLRDNIFVLSEKYDFKYLWQLSGVSIISIISLVTIIYGIFIYVPDETFIATYNNYSQIEFDPSENNKHDIMAFDKPIYASIGLLENKNNSNEIVFHKTADGVWDALISVKVSLFSIDKKKLMKIPMKKDENGTEKLIEKFRENKEVWKNTEEEFLVKKIIVDSEKQIYSYNLFSENGINMKFLFSKKGRMLFGGFIRKLEKDFQYPYIPFDFSDGFVIAQKDKICSNFQIKEPIELTFTNFKMDEMVKKIDKQFDIPHVMAVDKDDKIIDFKEYLLKKYKGSIPKLNTHIVLPIILLQKSDFAVLEGKLCSHAFFTYPSQFSFASGGIYVKNVRVFSPETRRLTFFDGEIEVAAGKTLTFLSEEDFRLDMIKKKSIGIIRGKAILENKILNKKVYQHLPGDIFGGLISAILGLAVPFFGLILFRMR